MKILVVTTKPPLPAIDGGRLVLWETVRGLAAAGAELRLVAPLFDPLDSGSLVQLQQVCTPVLVPARLRRWSHALVEGLRSGDGMALARHRQPGVSAAVAMQLREWRPDVLHVEQLQALPNVLATLNGSATPSPPVLLRTHNVESDLWAQRASAPGWRAPLLALSARSLRKHEARLLARVSGVLTLTPDDATRLCQLAPAAASRIVAHAPAFPQDWTAAAPLPESGESAAMAPVVLSGSAGWWPNAQALDWFVRRVLPLLGDVPVHVFGGDRALAAAPHLHWHPAPVESRDAFPAGAVVAVPLLQGSGIRMRILEAWSRGLPVVASVVAAAGLDIRDGVQLRLPANSSAGAFAATLRQVCGDPLLRQVLVAGGRDYLRTRHDARLQTEGLLTHYRQLQPTWAGESSG